MLEILYRIYEVADEETRSKNRESAIEFGLFSSTSKRDNIEILMDVMICDSREQFKGIIREMYGEDTPFRYSSKLAPGQLYCIIIGEHCYNSEKYFNKISFTCDHCGANVTTYLDRYPRFDNYEIRHSLFNIQEYANKKFCSSRCKEQFKQKVIRELKPGDSDEFFVSRDMFTQSVSGYIYKITKKSTGEFYIGQTQYAPMFRWAEHMKTERFPIQNIEDYIFEVIEIVGLGENILEREKLWIQAYYKEDPERSLNIAQTILLRKESPYIMSTGEQNDDE